MIFLFPFGGVCDRSLEEKSSNYPPGNDHISDFQPSTFESDGFSELTEIGRDMGLAPATLLTTNPPWTAKGLEEISFHG